MGLKKKDFIAQAKVLRTIRSDSIRRRLTAEQIKLFKRSNPRFDSKRFKDFVEKK